MHLLNCITCMADRYLQSVKGTEHLSELISIDWKIELIKTYYGILVYYSCVTSSSAIK